MGLAWSTLRHINMNRNDRRISLATNFRLGFAILASVYLLAGCSSDPSPWSQSSSPWGNKDASTEEVAAEEVAPEPNAFVEPVIAPEEAYTPIEPVVAKPVEPVEMEEPVVEAAPARQVAMATGGDIASQPAGYFAVQVCASRTIKQLSTFAKRHNLSDQWTAQTTVRGETWYVLLEGVYATRDEAKNALARVSGQVDTRPWIRTIGSLQAVMQ